MLSEPPLEIHGTMVRVSSLGYIRLREVLDCYLKTPAYFRAVGQSIPTWQDVESEYQRLAEDPSRFFLGVEVYRSSQLVGVVDVRVGYPTKEAATIGLLLIRADQQGKGIGSETLSLVEHHLKGIGTISRIWAGIGRGNRSVIKFWKSRGYKPTFRGFFGQIRWYEKKL
ncbi:MAG: GNAT family N-acetyltransferase [Armatimonadetes bacterium]|nr:GNAT family N-acetyltransferase [Armatimonadota bacterium]